MILHRRSCSVLLATNTMPTLTTLHVTLLLSIFIALELGCGEALQDISSENGSGEIATVRRAPEIATAPAIKIAPTVAEAPGFKAAPTIPKASSAKETPTADPSMETSGIDDSNARERDVEIVELLPPDAIPSIDAPRFFDSVDDADELYSAGELVLGIEIDGDARAYSVPLLSSHEIVNDVVGDKPVAVTW